MEKKQPKITYSPEYQEYINQLSSRIYQALNGDKRSFELFIRRNLSEILATNPHELVDHCFYFNEKIFYTIMDVLNKYPNCIYSEDNRYLYILNSVLFNIYSIYLFKEEDDKLKLIEGILYQLNPQVKYVVDKTGVPEYLVGQLIAARYSANDNITRFKMMINKLETPVYKKYFNINSLIWYISNICNDPFSDFFIGFMMSNDIPYFVDDTFYKYDLLSDAVFHIMDNRLDFNHLYNVLTKYYSVYGNGNFKPRFLLSSIDLSDYPNLERAVNLVSNKDRYKFRN